MLETCVVLRFMIKIVVTQSTDLGYVPEKGSFVISSTEIYFCKYPRLQ